jgi:hypothetical protein
MMPTYFPRLPVSIFHAIQIMAVSSASQTPRRMALS